MPYSLPVDGDGFEQTYYPRFIANKFPSYETFWIGFVIPLTNRPQNIQPKDDAALAAIGRTPQDVCIAQLHYSILRHLIRAFDLKSLPDVSVDSLHHAMSAVSGAQDTAFELLERFRNPAQYGPWLDKCRGGINGGREAQTAWKQHDHFPLQLIRDYRNNLIHGHTRPGFIINNVVHLPKIGRELTYLDWRTVTGAIPNQQLLADFDAPRSILNSAWTDTLQYLEARWQAALLPNI